MYKAAMANPSVSEEAKEHAQQVLNEELEGGNVEISDIGKDPGNVARGLKASITNPNVSEEAKREAQRKLENM
ncbi:hypothetical protein V1525DRAFT_391486 [Lipomyces kononenkoae]|uniref:Uncharacterized protein n=1 Tax=Lipomyces kononenkoae TaxID=34357 RepID=A0ACC3STH1_LIPKO